MHEQNGPWHNHDLDAVEQSNGQAPTVATPVIDGLGGVLFEQVEESILLANATGMIGSANPAAHRLFGVPPGDLAGRSVADLFETSSDDPGRLLQTIEADIARTGRWKGSLRRRKRDGTPFVTEARVGVVAQGDDSFRVWVERVGTAGLQANAPAQDGETIAEARLALGIEAGRLAIWDYDGADDRLTGSPELFRLLGFPPDAKPSMQEIRARYFPGDRDRLQAEGRAALTRGDRFVESEFRYIWPDGSIHWVLLRARAMPDALGRPTRALGVVMDITDRKRMEDALRASETRLRLAQEASGIGIWDWDLGSGAVSWSPEIYDVLGVDPLGNPPWRFRTWFRALHPADRAAAAKLIRHSAAEGLPFSIDFRLRSRPGTAPRWVRSRGSPVQGSDGKPSRFVGVNFDVTDERRREEGLLVLADDLRDAVLAAERERERIYELSNDLFAVIGRDGDLRALNPAWTRLMEEGERDLRGTIFLDLVHPDDREEARAALLGMRGGELRRFEARLLRADGITVWIAWAAAMESGRIYAVGRDVTVDKARDAALGQAQKMEALGQLTGGIAHDFNNLLQAVNGYLELIRHKPGDPVRVSQWAGNALLASERGTKLTAQLLAFSRSETIELSVVSVGSVLSGLGDLLLRTLGSAIRIHVKHGSDRLDVVADRTQLETALLNLAINARDAMPDGGDLTIATRGVTRAGDPETPAVDYVELQVRDTGTGMSAKVAARAFDPFFTTKSIGKGTGLGLSQVYAMAHHAGGSARIESRPGQGTVVFLLLLRAPPDDGVPYPHDLPVSIGRARRASVLVVDDDPDVRSLLADMLRSLGYGVTLAENGHAALSAIDRARPDLMLLDFAMAGMNGAEVARIAAARHPGMQIVIASGHADSAVIDAALGTGALRLRKPFRMGELDELLRSVLSGAAAAG